jgi:hypothetical protein
VSSNKKEISCGVSAHTYITYIHTYTLIQIYTLCLEGRGKYCIVAYVAIHGAVEVVLGVSGPVQVAVPQYAMQSRGVPVSRKREENNQGKV